MTRLAFRLFPAYVPLGWHPRSVTRPQPSRTSGENGEEPQLYKELCFVYRHEASYDRLNGGTSTAKSLITYRLQGFDADSDPKRDLTISSDTHPVGRMPDDMFKSAIGLGFTHEDIRAMASQGGFDYTAVCYVLGFVASRLILDVPVDLPMDNWPTADSAFGGAPDGLHSGATILTHAVWNGYEEFATLLSILSVAGVCHVYILHNFTVITQHAAEKERSVLSGCPLLRYVLGAAFTIMGAASQVRCAAQHLFAWYRGCHAASRLCAHCEEGGWLRGLLKTATYPPTVGIIPLNSTPILGFPPLTVRRTLELGGFFFEAYLLCTRCITAADPAVGLPGNTTGTVIFCLQSEPDGRPSSFPTLSTLVHWWSARFLRALCKCAGLIEDGVEGEDLFKSYWLRDEVDVSLKHKVIMPFFLVEPGPLDVFPEVADAFATSGEHGIGALVPLLSPETIFFTRMRNLSSDKFTAGPGGTARFVVDGFSTRRLGLSYIWNNVGAHDYLAKVRPVTDSERGYNSLELACVCGQPGNSLREARWKLPNCSIPNPIEGWGGARRRMFEIEFSGDNEQGCVEDFDGGLVCLKYFRARFVDPKDIPTPRCADSPKTVPVELLREFKMLDPSRDIGAALSRLQSEDNQGSPYVNAPPRGDGRLLWESQRF